MATYYIDPDNGSDLNTGADFDNAFASVTKGIEAIDFVAGTLILANSQNHYIDSHTSFSNDVRMNAAVTIRNADNDEDYTKVTITAAENHALRQNQAGGFTAKGVTFANSSHTSWPLLMVNGQVADITLTGVKLSNITGGNGSNGNVISVNSAAGGVVNMTRCVIDSCDNTATSGGIYNIITIWKASTTMLECTHSNCGDEDLGYRGNILIDTNFAARPIVSNIKNCTFLNNYTTGDGGCIYFYADATTYAGSTHAATVENCTFTNCQADLKGGGFWFGLDVLGYCYGCTFTDCTGGSGGVGSGAFGKGTNAVQATNQYIDAEGCLMVRCTAPDRGGAISVQGGSYANIRNCTFVDCASGIDGDAIYVFQKNTTHSSTLTSIDDCIFVGTLTNTNWILGQNNAAIGNVTNCIIEGGDATVADTGATVSGTTNATLAATLDSNYAPLSTSAAVGGSSKFWTGANQVGADGEPFSDIDTDIGGIQSKHGPFHPVNL